MESYVRMFDAHARPEGDNPTIMFKEERGDREVFGAEQGPSDLRRQEELDPVLCKDSAGAGPMRARRRFLSTA